MESELRDKIRKNPRDPMNYYYLAKELMKKPLKDLRSVREIELLLKKSIDIKPQLWAPKILLGELLYKLGRFSEAEPYFKESLKDVPSSESVKIYLTKCLSKKSDPDVNQYSQSKQDSLYIFYLRFFLWIGSIFERDRYRSYSARPEGQQQCVQVPCLYQSRV